MRNKIIVSGLSLLRDAAGPENDDCYACDYDLEWMFNYPSTLIWTDGIIVSPSIIKAIEQETSFYGDSKSWGKITRIFFEVASDLGLLEIKNPIGVLPENYLDLVEKQIDEDRNKLAESYPSDAKILDDGSPGGLTIIDQHYCSPRVVALYASLALSRVWGAQVLLDRRWELYLNYKLGIKNNTKFSAFDRLDSFSRVFSQYLPETELFPPEVYNKCRSCAKLGNCDEQNITRVEKKLKKYAEIREYDEIHQIKNVINKIILRAKDDMSPAEIEREFSDKQKKLRKQMRSIFPKVSRWSKMVTMLSIPVIVAGVSSGNLLVGGTGAAIAGTAQFTDKYLEVLENKNKWVFFKQTSGD